jgi:hypothetical protein
MLKARLREPRGDNTEPPDTTRRRWTRRHGTSRPCASPATTASKPHGVGNGSEYSLRTDVRGSCASPIHLGSFPNPIHRLKGGLK